MCLLSTHLNLNFPFSFDIKAIYRYFYKEEEKHKIVETQDRVQATELRKRRHLMVGHFKATPFAPAHTHTHKFKGLENRDFDINHQSKMTKIILKKSDMQASHPGNVLSVFPPKPDCAVEFDQKTFQKLTRNSETLLDTSSFYSGGKVLANINPGNMFQTLFSGAHM